MRLSSAEPVGVPFGATPLDAVVMGASAGGPPAIESIVASLPHAFPAAIVVCQHMPPGFTTLWAERLDGVCHMRVKEAAQAYGSRAMGVLLTGLGTDGALGMLALRRAGCFTVCQAAETAVASSMPLSAMELGAAAEEASVDEMAHLIAMHVTGRA